MTRNGVIAVKIVCHTAIVLVCIKLATTQSLWWLVLLGIVL